MNSAPTPEGLLRFRTANLVDGFTDTFTSRYVDAPELCMHAIIGGEGPPLLLVPAWPGPGTPWQMLIAAPARDYKVIAVDPRGSGRPTGPTGRTRAPAPATLVAPLDGLDHTRFALYGTDTGPPIAHKFRRLTMPVLAIVGAESTHEGIASTTNCAAPDVQCVVVADRGHRVAEPAPGELLAPPTAFPASQRDAGNQRVGQGASTTSTASATIIEDTSIPRKETRCPTPQGQPTSYPAPRRRRSRPADGA